MVDACIRTGTHYLDITGEIPVFEACHGRTEEAREAGVTLLPGAGFDVVPSDCLAAALHAAVPDATRLYLAIKAIGTPSRGTAKTMVEGVAAGGAVRRNGWIESVPTAYKTRTIPFHDKLRSAMTIPWGDVSTAYFSTGIGNIEVFMALPQRVILAAKVSRPFGPLLGLGTVQRALKDRIDRGAPGPDEAARVRGRSELWGRVEGPAGRGLEGTLTTPEGYALTVQTALECVRRVARGQAPTGAVTPSMAFGPRFIEEFEGCVLRVEPT
ncbi:MAG: saccharopine dehydrogenase [Deltaproteobacteria bacterium]|nr:saccharopine dehydrogenase [Deltaproteobacteria bacterium]